ncbi:DUF6276 family protein [Natrinema pallidum]|uniref:Uncharacterized protein n=1 Tax=Natrinema pallidum DSM 3751 TaxID=1227495 RepID=L9Z8C9_9EURY|nr:DUF6276 family protein [Natrinema pallidum]ELY82770.1 hypothetical protein C487_01385 [Natrinema pallidum DSM 3751]
MTCSECGAPTILCSVPAEYRTDAPAAVISFCTRCLSLEPAPQADRDGAGTDEEAPATPDFERVSDAFPTRPERAVPFALALGLCPSLATNRTAIELLLREVESAGGDPLLLLERLSDDPSVEPAFDLERRRHQLEQLLY